MGAELGGGASLGNKGLKTPEIREIRMIMSWTKESRVLMNDGNTIPVVGLGTFAPPEFPKSMAEEAVKVALEVGYRHIDSAFLYCNEVEVGRGINAKIADGTLKREHVFYTGKLWNTFHVPELVRPALERSLKNLNLEYMDLFLIHSTLELKPGDDMFPADEQGQLIYNNTDIRDTWRAMEECKEAGLTKSIGVSNFSRDHLQLILSMPDLRHKPVCNQVECHLYLSQGKMLEFCRSHDMVLVAYGVLGSTRDLNWVDQSSPILLEDPLLNAIARKHGRTPAEVAMRHLLQKGIVVLAKSFKPDRIKQNLKVFEFELSDDDVKSLDGLNRNRRFINTDMFKNHPKYPFSEDL